MWRPPTRATGPAADFARQLTQLNAAPAAVQGYVRDMCDTVPPRHGMSLAMQDRAHTVKMFVTLRGHMLSMHCAAHTTPPG
jgi:hypothetical protein